MLKAGVTKQIEFGSFASWLFCLWVQCQTGPSQAIFSEWNLDNYSSTRPQVYKPVQAGRGARGHLCVGRTRYTSRKVCLLCSVCVCVCMCVCVCVCLCACVFPQHLLHNVWITSHWVILHHWLPIKPFHFLHMQHLAVLTKYMTLSLFQPRLVIVTSRKHKTVIDCERLCLLVRPNANWIVYSRD